MSRVTRDASHPTQSELDSYTERTWSLPEYLDAPGIIRKGRAISRREVLKHMANEMGGVHLAKSTSELKDILAEAENKLFLETKEGLLRTHYLEVLAIGQAVGRSPDFQTLATTIRSRLRTTPPKGALKDTWAKIEEKSQG